MQRYFPCKHGKANSSRKKVKLHKSNNKKFESNDASVGIVNEYCEPKSVQVKKSNELL